MAKKLGIGVGDTVSLYGSGYHGTTAAALLQVEGIVKLPFKTMDNGMVFFALPMAQDVFSCNGRITSLSVMVKSITGLEEVRETIESSLGDDRVVMSWDEMMPDLKQSIEVDNVGGIISLAVLYIVIAFGIFGTIMMMVSERTREFAVLISVGMQKFKLLIITAIEAIMVSFIGVIAGIITSIPVILYFVHNPIYLGAEYADLYEQYGIEPILNFSSDPMVFISQALVVLVIALATIIYPVLFIRKMNIAKTIRG
jgi:ABC-type lipoprotein release transport system permease subunit